MLRVLPLRALALAICTLSLWGCDTTDNDDGTEIIVRTFTADDDEFVDANGGLLFSYERDVSAMTSRVVDDGAVLLYVGNEILFIQDDPTWTALPITDGIDEDGDGFVDFTYTFTYSYGLGKIYIDMISSSPLDFEASFGDLDFRLVLIPGDRFAGSSATLDLSNYDAVKKAFELSD